MDIFTDILFELTFLFLQIFDLFIIPIKLNTRLQRFYFSLKILIILFLSFELFLIVFFTLRDFILEITVFFFETVIFIKKIKHFQVNHWDRCGILELIILFLNIFE